MLGRIVQNIVRNIGILYNNVKIIGKKKLGHRKITMKLAGKVRQIRDKLGKVITVPPPPQKKAGARVPMQRLECWFNISKWKASTVFIL